MSRRYMDWSGNIIDRDEAPELEVVRTTEGTEIDLKNALHDPFEQHMANLTQDEEDMEDVEGPCQYEADDIITCPNYFPADEDPETPDVIECRICGRMDWKKKPSIGRSMGSERLV